MIHEVSDLLSQSPPPVRTELAASDRRIIIAV
jgi:hypothetical protein